MDCSDLGGSRKITFDVKSAEGSGLQFPIGRASLKDPERLDRENNFLFHEKSLSKKHAVLCIKRLFPAAKDPYVPLLDQFRISVQDLGSTHGLVDLQSQDSDTKIIDLRNGERFGLIKLYQPIAAGQSRGAKLKFQVFLKTNEEHPDSGTLDLILSNVTYDDSPFVSRPTTMGAKEISSSSSSSELNFSEDFDLELENYERCDSREDECSNNERRMVVGNDEAEGEEEEDDDEDDADDDAMEELCHTERPQNLLFVADEELGVDREPSGVAITILDSPIKNTTPSPDTEAQASRETTPQCYDCATAVDVPDEDEFDAVTDDSACETRKKRCLDVEDDEIVVIEEVKKIKLSTGSPEETQPLPVDTKKIIVGSMLGFVAGSVGTLGLLVGIANMG
ncbi:LANO_0E04566g1_1 [Lachancea nothofagi CBS 11611]|uniref:LANO_0E04566g1_1 n=1 Tax=Lachancea nothofagi CBS 11611 TaxID=1266666 RepID=A0A1G4JS66_9SACH|nr:LANO_0E04566g1_1 [Lachancea nothofagi CBS 11611]